MPRHGRQPLSNPRRETHVPSKAPAIRSGGHDTGGGSRGGPGPGPGGHSRHGDDPCRARVHLVVPHQRCRQRRLPGRRLELLGGRLGRDPGRHGGRRHHHLRPGGPGPRGKRARAGYVHADRRRRLGVRPGRHRRRHGRRRRRRRHLRGRLPPVLPPAAAVPDPRRPRHHRG